MIRSGLALAFLLVLSVVAQAKTVVVAKPAAGSDGSAELAAALANVVDGDKLVIQKGVYMGQILLDGASNVRIVGKKGAVLDVADADGVIRLTGSDNVTISGLEIVSRIGACIDAFDCEALEIVKCVLRGDHTRGVSLDSCDDVTISKCRMSDTGTAIQVEASNDVVIAKSRMSDHATNAVVVGVSVPAGTVTFTRNRAERCGIITIAASLGTFEVSRNKFLECGRLAVGGTTPVITRNVHLDGTDSGIVSAGLGVEITRNTIKNCLLTGIRGAPGANDAVISRNKVFDAGEHGFLVQGLRSLTERNKGVRAGIDAFRFIVIGDSTVDRNVSLDAGAVGFNLFLDGGTISRNKAKRSGTFGVQSDQPIGAFTLDRNKFDSEDFAAPE